MWHCKFSQLSCWFVSVLFSIAGASGALGGEAHAEAAPRLLSAHALVWDTTTNKAIYAKGAEQVTPIASVTKLMMAIVVLDSGAALDEAIVISEDDRDLLKGSRSRLPIGSTLPRRELLRLALMASENRAAAALARAHPGGSTAFVAAMNAKAKALQMVNSRFADSTGLASANVSTAADLARLVSAAAGYPLVREFTTQGAHFVEVGPSGRILGFNNSNPLVRSDGWDIQVSKTGFIREAGRCLVMLANVASRPTVIVLLDSAGRYSRLGDAHRIKHWLETGQVLPLPQARKKAPRRTAQAARAQVRRVARG